MSAWINSDWSVPLRAGVRYSMATGAVGQFIFVLDSDGNPRVGDGVRFRRGPGGWWIRPADMPWRWIDDLIGVGG